MNEMKPGRELDALIAEKVMGLPVKKHPYSDHLVVWYGGREMHCIEDYSTDISAAWEVVEKLRLAIAPGDEGGWIAASSAYHLDTGRAERADTAPHAICLAALKTVGGD